MKVHVSNETGSLQSVIVGIATNIDPVDKVKGQNQQAFEARQTQTYPGQEEVQAQVEAFAAKLVEVGIRVYRPNDIPGLEQIFVRDLGVVIGTTFVRSPMMRADRMLEFAGIKPLLGDLEIVTVDDPEAKFETGDVILRNGVIYVGTGNRTNQPGLEWIRAKFGADWEIVEVKLRPWTQENQDPHGVLHLDCCFQPVGTRGALVYPAGIIEPSVVTRRFAGRQTMLLSKSEKNTLGSNVFSISPSTTISQKGAYRINARLGKGGRRVVELPYWEVIKLGGAFRCSTLPLFRE